jgi:hypothetical protein
LGQRGASFIRSAHPGQNLGEHSILPRFVRSPGHGALLNLESFVKSILPKPHSGD